MLDTPTAQARF